MNIIARYSLTARSACCGCLLAAAIPLNVAFADWETVSDVRMAVEANDNPRLGQDPEQLVDPETAEHTAVRALMDARVDLENLGPRGSVFFQPRVRVDTYADAEDDDLERQDMYLNARAAYEWTRTSAGVRVNLTRESILSSEIVDTDFVDPGDVIEDPIDTDTGRLVLLDEHRDRVVLAPYADFSISERSAITLEARYLDVGYTGLELRGRSDFSDLRLALGVGRTIDDRTSAAANLIVSRYEADATQNETDTVGVEGTFNRTLSETWSFGLTTGLQRSEFAFVDANGLPVDNATTDFTMNLGFTKQSDLATLELAIARFLNPNAVGFLVERNELRVFYQRQMSERLTTGFGLRLMETAALDSPADDERDFARFDFDLQWAFTPSWSLQFGFGAVDQTFSGVQLDGNANIVSVGAVYRGLSRRDAGN